MENLLGIGCLIYAIYLAISKRLPYRKEVMLKKGTENTCLKIEIIAFICLFLVFEMMYLISFFIRGSIILGIFSIIGGSLLINVTNSNKVFQTSTKYKTGCAFTIIGGGLMSIACILLYISFFYKNQPSNELRSGEFNSKAIYYDYGDDKSEQVDDSIKNKVSLLRELKNKGEINDQEFRDMLMDLIKRKEEQD